jgi:catechol 2,3-dioxygenase-like lactoylglutathione lyase family enzyme
MPSSPLTIGVDHLGLAVRDLELTRKFFVDCLGWKQVGERPDYPAAFVSDGHSVLTLWQVTQDGNEVTFDRKRNVGLHHLALRLRSEDDLRKTVEHIKDWPGVRIEFFPEYVGKGPKLHAMFYEPSGIRIELDFDPRLGT